MADQQSRDEGGQGSAAQSRHQVDPQRHAEEGGSGLSRTGGPRLGAGSTVGGPGQHPTAPQDARTSEPPGASGTVAHAGKVMSDPDVVLQIPYVKVEQIYVEVDDLDAHVSLRARLGNLLQLDVGVQARLGTVKIDIKGVETEAMLEVRLEQLQGILDRALSTIERNPQIIEAVVRTVDTAVNQVGQTAQQVLGPQGPLARTLDQVGQTAQQALGPGGPLAQTLQQATQQLGQTTGQLGQQVAQNAQQAGGGPVGSPTRAAWQRMKKIVKGNQPLRRATARLVASAEDRQQRGG